MNSMQVHGAGLHRTTRLASRQPASARQLHPAHHSRAHRVIAFADNGISSGAAVCVRGLTFHPAGAEQPLLDDISLDLPALSMGLLIGRSGSGKTTLLNVLAGLCEQTSGSVHIIPRHAAPAHLSGPPSRNGNDGLPTSSSSSSSNGSSHNGQPAQNQPRGARFAARMAAENRPVQPVASKVTAPSNSSSSSLDGSAQNGTASSIVQQQPSSSSSSQLLLPPACSVEERMARVGLVFQFPERHFLGHNVLSELTFTWPPAMSQNALALADMNRRISMAMSATGLQGINIRLPPWALSGGQQRRLALALQLIRSPSVLLLDEPLAGLDWQARKEVVEILAQLKKQCTLFVVSHDLKELAPLVDCAWSMQLGGKLQPTTWPPNKDDSNKDAAVMQEASVLASKQ